MKASTKKLTPVSRASKDRLSAHGHPFNLRSDFWRLRDYGRREVINFALLKNQVSPSLFESIKDVFAPIAQGRTAGTSSMLFYSFNDLVQHIYREYGRPISSIEPEYFASWVGKTKQTNGSAISRVRTVIETWKKLQVPGLAEDAVEFSERLQRPTDEPDYVGVRTWDPAKGPYRPVEDEAIRVAIDDAFNSGTISLYDYAMIRSFRATGVRPVLSDVSTLGTDLRI